MCNPAPLTISLQTSDGNIFELDAQIMSDSPFIRACNDSCMFQAATPDEVIPLPSIHSRELLLVLKFLENNKKEPVERILRPLDWKSTGLVEAGVPEWADDYIFGISALHLLDLAEAAKFMQVNMLYELCGARMALEILKRGGVGELRKRFFADYVVPLPSPSRFLAQNKWAWDVKDEPVTCDEENEKY